MSTSSKEELIAKIHELEKELKKIKSKKYGLVWEDKPEEFEEESKNALPVLEEKKGFKEVKTKSDASTHILIEGDNYHSLSVLSYTHRGTIDLIYIDPPYNTGSQSWRYNNDYVEKDDPWRHSKWLSMMAKRLKLSKPLLSSSGTIIVAIDDYEVSQLGLLLDEIFQGYEKDLIIVEHHPQGAGSNTVSRTHEYAYICTPKGIGFEGRLAREEEGRWALRRSGQGENNWRKNRPKQFFAILVDEGNRKIIGVGDDIPKNEKKYPLDKTEDGYLRIYPIDGKGKERCWRYNRETMLNLIKQGNIEYTSKGSLIVKKESVNAVPVFSIWRDPKYNAGAKGSTLLTEIMGQANTFPYPKSLYTVLDMISLVIKNKKDAIVLDYFCGSGTTGHAVLDLNREDKGNRQFILCTNNENNICEEVTYERLRRVMQGYNGSKGKVEGLGGNLKYFKTAFIRRQSASSYTDEDKLELTQKTGCMLALKENTFDEMESTKYWQVFENKNQVTGIYFREDKSHLQEFVGKLAKGEKRVNLYIFSWAKGEYKNAFLEYPNITAEDIPEPILDVYKTIGL